MKWIAILTAAGLALACEDSPVGTSTVGGSLAPSAAGPRLSIAPSPVLIVPIAAACIAPQRAFTTAFDLVIVATSTAAVDRVTFRLIDGSTMGGPTLTFPRPQLQQMFGSTSLRGPRLFHFQPQFGCGLPAATLTAEVVVVTASGETRTSSASTAIR